jgi:fimbrial isopeptide formation D2 family protein
MSYDFTKDGKYSVNITVATSVGTQTGPSCEKTLTVSPLPPCTVNPNLPQNSSDCKPCENDNAVWYKDKDCHSEFLLTKSVKNISQAINDANNTTAMPGNRLEYHLTAKNVGKTTGTYTIQDNLSDVLEYADIVDMGGGTLTKSDANTPVENVNMISWPAAEIKPGQTIEKIVSVQVKSTIPATPQSPGNLESYNCRMVNNFADSHTTVAVDCPAPKVVEQVVTELPHTGATENMVFAGVVLAIVVYFYARTRQVKKEVRLVRRDLNAGTI